MNLSLSGGGGGSSEPREHPLATALLLAIMDVKGFACEKALVYTAVMPPDTPPHSPWLHMLAF